VIRTDSEWTRTRCYRLVVSQRGRTPCRLIAGGCRTALSEPDSGTGRARLAHIGASRPRRAFRWHRWLAQPSVPPHPRRPRSRSTAEFRSRCAAQLLALGPPPPVLPAHTQLLPAVDNSYCKQASCAAVAHGSAVLATDGRVASEAQYTPRASHYTSCSGRTIRSGAGGAQASELPQPSADGSAVVIAL